MEAIRRPAPWFQVGHFLEETCYSSLFEVVQPTMRLRVDPAWSCVVLTAPYLRACRYQAGSYIFVRKQDKTAPMILFLHGLILPLILCSVLRQACMILARPNPGENRGEIGDMYG